MLISLLERGERCKYRHREKGGGQGRGSNNANGNNGGGWSSSDNPAHLLEQMKSMMDQVQPSPKRALSSISDLKPSEVSHWKMMIPPLKRMAPQMQDMQGMMARGAMQAQMQQTMSGMMQQVILLVWKYKQEMGG